MTSRDSTSAISNRSVRNIKSELAFLAETNAISSDNLIKIIELLPSEANVQSDTLRQGMERLNVDTTSRDGRKSPLSYNNPTPQPQQSSPFPPPAYPSAPPPPLARAIALYAYQPTDAGDLELAPNDHIAVTEYMNAEWWKGRSERTGQEGIFPRTYVRVDDDKTGPPTMPQQQGAYQSNYGNMPLDVSQQGGGQQQPQDNKVAGAGKKFGKKLGNAAIFGAGATIGSDIVNSIF